MHVVHYLPAVNLAEGGVVRAVLDLCALTAARGQRVTLATFDAKDAPWGGAASADHGNAGSSEADRPLGVPRVCPLSGKPVSLGLLPEAALAQMQAVLAGASFLHLHGPWDPAHVQLARAARAAGVPYGVTAHGMLDDWSMAQKPVKKKLFLALFGKRLLRGGAWLHCTAEGEAAQVRRLLPRVQVVVAPLAFDARPFIGLPGKGAPADLPRILFLSRIHPKKGLEKLIAACAVLRERGTPVALGVAGGGEASYVERLRVEAQWRRVEAEFLGMVSGAEKVKVLCSADAFVLPTSQENFGLALIEAMACAVPVITTRGVDIWPELQAAGAQILESNPTPERLADAIAAMLSAPDRAQRAARGRAWVLEALAGERVGAVYENLYAHAEARRRAEMQ